MRLHASCGVVCSFSRWLMWCQSWLKLTTFIHLPLEGLIVVVKKGCLRRVKFTGLFWILACLRYTCHHDVLLRRRYCCLICVRNELDNLLAWRQGLQGLVRVTLSCILSSTSTNLVWLGLDNGVFRELTNLMGNLAHSTRAATECWATSSSRRICRTNPLGVWSAREVVFQSRHMLGWLGSSTSRDEWLDQVRVTWVRLLDVACRGLFFILQRKGQLWH